MRQIQLTQLISMDIVTCCWIKCLALISKQMFAALLPCLENRFLFLNVINFEFSVVRKLNSRVFATWGRKRNHDKLLLYLQKWLKRDSLVYVMPLIQVLNVGLRSTGHWKNFKWNYSALLFLMTFSYAFTFNNLNACECEYATNINCRSELLNLLVWHND